MSNGQSSDYGFGRTSFKNFVWVNKGAFFQEAKSMDIESANRLKYRVELINPAGQVFRYFTIDPTPPSGLWHTVDFQQYYLPGSWPKHPPETWQEDKSRQQISSPNFKIKLVNQGSGTCKLVQGLVYL